MLDAVTKGYLAAHPEDAARTLSRLDRRDAAEAFSAMPRPLAGQVLSVMAPASAAGCLAVLPRAVAGEILTRTPLSAAVAALRLLDQDVLREVLQLLPRPKAARIRLRLRFSEWVIGAFVDEDVLTLSPEHRVGDAFRLFRAAGRHTGQTIAVVDARRRLVGMVDLCELLGNPDRRMVRHLMQAPEHVLSARAAIQTVVKHPAWTTHDSLPVINRTGVFQGVLHRASVREEEAHMVNEIVQRNELIATRTALADIFWLAVGSLFVSSGRGDGRGARGD